MKRAMLLFALISVPTLFQTAPAFADTLNLDPAAAPASQKAERPAKVKPVPKGRLARMRADARHCLDMRTNHAVIKCANRYL
jgi:hypothetical protein